MVFRKKGMTGTWKIVLVYYGCNCINGQAASVFLIQTVRVVRSLDSVHSKSQKVNNRIYRIQSE